MKRVLHYWWNGLVRHNITQHNIHKIESNDAIRYLSTLLVLAVKFVDALSNWRIFYTFKKWTNLCRELIPQANMVLILFSPVNSSHLYNKSWHWIRQHSVFLYINIIPRFLAFSIIYENSVQSPKPSDGRVLGNMFTFPITIALDFLEFNQYPLTVVQ